MQPYILEALAGLVFAREQAVIIVDLFDKHLVKNLFKPRAKIGFGSNLQAAPTNL